VAENAFDPKNFGLLAALAEPRRNSLLDYVAPPTPKPEVSPLARAIADLLMDKPKPALPVSPFSGAASDLFAPPKFASPQYPSGILGAVADLFPPAKPVLPVSPYPYSGALADLFGTPEATTAKALSGAVADLFPTTAPSSPFSLAGLMATPPPLFPPASASTQPFGSLAGLVTPPGPPPSNALYAPPPKPKPVAPEKKRKAFFSFHFDDIMRVNNVRNTWKITHPDSSSNRSFYDSSLWEERKLVGPEGIKQLIRAGVLGTSAVCVLAGSDTWDRRWVRYEIARAIIDGRGLLTVHLNGINHHQTKGPHPRGRNPLAHMGIAKLQLNKLVPPQYYLYEMNLVPDGYGGTSERWNRYNDYTAPVKKPTWLTDPSVDNVVPLSVGAAEYDYELEHGDRNIGSWLDKAAKQAGR
jgi:MTH538 TIR-like domain (DUF1863)